MRLAINSQITLDVIGMDATKALPEPQGLKCILSRFMGA